MMGNDSFVVRAVVVFLGLIALTVVGGGIWLAAYERSLGDALIAMGSGALGGLTGFLISSRVTADSAATTTTVETTTVTPPPLVATPPGPRTGP